MVWTNCKQRAISYMSICLERASSAPADARTAGKVMLKLSAWFSLEDALTRRAPRAQIDSRAPPLGAAAAATPPRRHARHLHARHLPPGRNRTTVPEAILQQRSAPLHSLAVAELLLCIEISRQQQEQTAPEQAAGATPAQTAAPAGPFCPFATEPLSTIPDDADAAVAVSLSACRPRRMTCC